MPRNDQDPSESELDHLLVKYVYVWLWSILLATTTTVAFSFISYRSDRWGLLGAGLILLVLIGGACIAASLLLLSRFLRGFLLPIFFGGLESEPKQRQGAARLLGQSFRFLIYAVIFRFLMSAAQLMLDLGGHFESFK
jgi:hypothetical protein